MTQKDIVIDSGGSKHVVCKRSYLREVQQVHVMSVEIANGMKAMYNLKGKINVDAGSRKITITSAYFTPGINLNILSCAGLKERGVSTKIERGICIYTDRIENVTFARMSRRNTDGLFVTKLMPRSECAAESRVASKEGGDQTCNEKKLSRTANRLCHLRVAHANGRNIKAMLDSKRYGMTNAETTCTQDRFNCVVAKHTESSDESELTEMSKIAKIHADICGTMRTTSYDCSWYFLAMTAVQQRYVRIKLLKNREKLEGYFHEYIRWIERHTKMKVGRKYTDNAAFFSMRRGLEKLAIRMTISSAYTPQYDGMAERMNRTLLDKAR